jgi:uncharacterized protein (DUF433 family)
VRELLLFSSIIWLAEDTTLSSNIQEPVIEQHLAEVPLYLSHDVARYLSLPISVVLAAAGGIRDYPSAGWLLPVSVLGLSYTQQMDELLAPSTVTGSSVGLRDILTQQLDRFLTALSSSEIQVKISFRRFAELFVRATAVQWLMEWGSGENWSKDRWENFALVVFRGLKDSSQKADLSEETPTEGQITRAAAPFFRLNPEELSVLRKCLALSLGRVDFEEAVPARVYPFCGDRSENSRRMIVFDPRIRFGRPTIAGSGIPTDILFERYLAGDSLTFLAEDYDLTPEEIEEAIRFEASGLGQSLSFFGW